MVNWIDGYNSTRTEKKRVPAIFGMNFQAVSVGQKLAKAGDADTDKTLTGGYLDANAVAGLQDNQQDRAAGRAGPAVPDRVSDQLRGQQHGVVEHPVVEPG